MEDLENLFSFENLGCIMAIISSLKSADYPVSFDKEDIWISILYFLLRYAFERQSCDKGFAHAATDSVEKIGSKTGRQAEAELPKAFYETHKNLLNIKKKVRYDNNKNKLNFLICPSYPSYNRNKKNDNIIYHIFICPIRK
ncbi:MAG TPA: hypothetical protein ENO29_06940 [Candidatus Aminicenantes bacterium]|nr:MAG: hypothetical protein C0168_01575 [Candidatus Aminicenantes bacterium]HEK86073.1 hypothetical protein [Candidatus Aminicenantes bacterium]